MIPIFDADRMPYYGNQWLCCAQIQWHANGKQGISPMREMGYAGQLPLCPDCNDWVAQHYRVPDDD